MPAAQGGRLARAADAGVPTAGNGKGWGAHLALAAPMPRVSPRRARPKPRTCGLHVSPGARARARPAALGSPFAAAAAAAATGRVFGRPRLANGAGHRPVGVKTVTPRALQLGPLKALPPPACRAAADQQCLGRRRAGLRGARPPGQRQWRCHRARPDAAGRNHPPLHAGTTDPPRPPAATTRRKHPPPPSSLHRLPTPLVLTHAINPLFFLSHVRTPTCALPVDGVAKPARYWRMEGAPASAPLARRQPPPTHVQHGFVCSACRRPPRGTLHGKGALVGFRHTHRAVPAATGRGWFTTRSRGSGQGRAGAAHATGASSKGGSGGKRELHAPRRPQRQQPWCGLPQRPRRATRAAGGLHGRSGSDPSGGARRVDRGGSNAWWGRPPRWPRHRRQPRPPPPPAASGAPGGGGRATAGVAGGRGAGNRGGAGALSLPSFAAAAAPLLAAAALPGSQLLPPPPPCRPLPLPAASSHPPHPLNSSHPSLPAH